MYCIFYFNVWKHFAALSGSFRICELGKFLLVFWKSFCQHLQHSLANLIRIECIRILDAFQRHPMPLPVLPWLCVSAVDILDDRSQSLAFALRRFLLRTRPQTDLTARCQRLPTNQCWDKIHPNALDCSDTVLGIDAVA